MNLPQRLASDLIDVRAYNHAACAVNGKSHGESCTAQTKVQDRQRAKLPALSHSVLEDMLAIVGEDVELHAKLRWVVAHFKPSGLVDSEGNEANLGDFFDPDELIEKLKPLIQAALTAYCIGEGEKSDDQ